MDSRFGNMCYKVLVIVYSLFKRDLRDKISGSNYEEIELSME